MISYFESYMKMTESDLQNSVDNYVVPVDTCLNVNDRIEDALKKIRIHSSTERALYFYAIDDEGKLVGTLSTRTLLLTDPTCFVGEVVQKKVVRLASTHTLEEAMKIFEKYHLLALPVVDAEGRLLGTLDIGLYMEGSFNVADARHRRDVFQMLGISVENGKKVSVFDGYRYRMPWLFCNMVSGLVCAVIANINETVLNEFLILAMFIPLVLTLSESVSMQSMTQSLQFLRRPKITLRYLCLQVKKEWAIVFFVAISSCFLVGALSLLWGDGLFASIIIGLSIFISVLISAGFGIVFPIFIHKTELDPKVASGPVVLMFADAFTTLFYLSFASWALL
ncbi:MAG: magnesium transporter [Chlamydiota bacterium]